MVTSPPHAPTPAASGVRWSDYAAVLFDLDGVVTPTAEVHMRAWAEMFNAFLVEYAEDHPDADATPYTDADYFAHVDGKPRYDGVRDFLAARSITLPEGDEGASSEGPTVRGLGDRKNDAFNEVLARPAVVERLSRSGITPIANSTPASIAAWIAAEIGKWRTAFKLAGLQPE